jgi:hypothetical protein
MAVLTDGSPNKALDLQVYETSILDVAATEKIDLDAKLGLALEEISEDVLNVLLDHTRDPQSNSRRNRGVSDVVVTSPMKRWHALHTLSAVYRDAFSNQLNDRYAAKLKEYRELSRQARVKTLEYGIGLVMSPVPKAGPAVLTTVGGPGTAGTYYVAVSWVSAQQQEGSASDVSAIATADGFVVEVSAAGPPAAATGFKVYAGASADVLMLQTPVPVTIGQSFTLPGVAAGAEPGDGQIPEVYVTGGSMLRRG